MRRKEILGTIDTLSIVLKKADGSIILGDTEIKPVTNDFLKKVLEKVEKYE